MKKLILLLTVIVISPYLFATTIPIDAIRNQYQVPALGGLIARDTVIKRYIAGVRKWGDSTLATVDDKFHLGSCTKAMTATLIAIFVERGQLKWESTMAQIFPELVPQMNSSFKNVTVDMLTSHRSGITADIGAINNGDLWAKLSDPQLDPMVGRQMLVATVFSQPPATTPGSTYEYSNINYMIAGAILERITGISWEIIITYELFCPLAMNSCGFGAPGDPNAIVPDQPWPHQVANNIPVPIKPDFHGDNPPSLGPAGTVHCSMADWAKFGKLHVDGFNGINTPILKASSFVKLHTPYPGQNYTYGGWVRTTADWAGGTVLTHNGSNTMNYAEIWLAPLKNMVLLSATNVADTRGGPAVGKTITALTTD